MKHLFLIFFCFSLTICFSQNQHQGIVVDADSKEPIEFASIYNKEDHTITNADGRFLFSSNLDSVYIYNLGHKKIGATFKQLKDTIYLEKNLFELDEVVVTNIKTTFQKVQKAVAKNYSLEPYKEKFFLRGVLKYNDTITRIQDIQGKLERKTLLYHNNIKRTNKDYTIELTNMRKIGIVKDANNVYFNFPTFYGLFSEFVRINATGDGFTLTENYFDDGKKIKLKFDSNNTNEVYNISGYYMINTENYAIESFYLKTISKNVPYLNNKDTYYRTPFYEVQVFFSKDPKKDKYFMSSAKQNAKIELTDEQKTYKSFYDCSFILSTSNNFENFEVKKNVNSTKDIFKLKHPYDASFWKTQNQLLLTNEMLEFIKRAKDKNSEFKIRTNLK